jgi:hypothetical protein
VGFVLCWALLVVVWGSFTLSAVLTAVANAPVSILPSNAGTSILRFVGYLAVPACAWGIGLSAPIKPQSPHRTAIRVAFLVLTIVGACLVAAGGAFELAHAPFRTVGVLVAAGFVLAGAGVVAAYVARVGSFGETGEEDLRTEAEKIRERRAAELEGGRE